MMFQLDEFPPFLMSSPLLRVELRFLASDQNALSSPLSPNVVVYSDEKQP